MKIHFDNIGLTTFKKTHINIPQTFFENKYKILLLHY